MAFAQSDLEAIQAAIAKGELEVELDGRRVRYRSMPELLAAEQRIAGALAGRVRQTQIVASKGLC